MLWPITSRIFAIDRGVPHFNTFTGDIDPDKFYLSRN